MNKVISAAVVILSLSSCAVIRPGEIGVRQTLGKLSEKGHGQGTLWYNPLVSKVIKVNTQINNIELCDNQHHLLVKFIN